MIWKILIAIITIGLNIWPASRFIASFTKNWRTEIEKEDNERDSLDNAGKWIGILERLLILTFIFLHQYTAIGFLIAAKFVLRISDKDSSYPRKQTEYVLIGT